MPFSVGEYRKGLKVNQKTTREEKREYEDVFPIEEHFTLTITKRGQCLRQYLARSPGELEVIKAVVREKTVGLNPEVTLFNCKTLESKQIEL